MAANAVIYDTKSLRIIGGYGSYVEARRRLEAARERGHKLRGYKYPATMLERMDVTTAVDFEANIDHNVTVKSIMSGKDVTIRRSQQGNPVYDPSMEGYWSM